MNRECARREEFSGPAGCQDFRRRAAPSPAPGSGFSDIVTTAMATATETKARYIELVARPISILPTDAARIYAFIHPSVLGLYFIARFPALVADPVSCLLIDLVPVALIQCSYVITCLPIAGSSPAPAQAAKKGKPGAQKRTVSPKTGATMSRKISVRLPADPRADRSPPSRC